MLEELRTFDPETASRLHENNLGRIIRAIEVYRLTGITMWEHQLRSRSQPSPYTLCYLGLNYRNRSILYERINRRVDQMLEQGMLEECRAALEGGLSHTAVPGHWIQGIPSVFFRYAFFRTVCGKPEAGDKEICQAAADLVPA